MFKKKNTSQLLGVEDTPIKPPKAEKPKKEKEPKEPISIGSFFRNRMALAIFAIIFAFVVAFVIMPIAEASLSKSTEVVRITKDVRQGEIITPEIIEVSEAGALNLANDVIKEKDMAVGKYAKMEMLAGDIVQEKKLSDVMPSDDTYLLTLPEGKMAMSVAVDGSADAVASKLRAGDIVRIFAIDEDKKGITPTELQFVEILAVTNAKVRDINNGDREKADITEEDGVINTITLAVNDEQATALVELQKIQFALVFRGDIETVKNLLNEANKAVANVKSEVE